MKAPISPDAIRTCSGADGVPKTCIHTQHCGAFGCLENQIRMAKRELREKSKKMQGQKLWKAEAV